MLPPLDKKKIKIDISSAAKSPSMKKRESGSVRILRGHDRENNQDNFNLADQAIPDILIEQGSHEKLIDENGVPPRIGAIGKQKSM